MASVEQNATLWKAGKTVLFLQLLGVAFREKKILLSAGRLENGEDFEEATSSNCPLFKEK